LTWRNSCRPCSTFPGSKHARAVFRHRGGSRSHERRKAAPRLHDGVNQFSRFGRAKVAAWNQFAQHISYQQGDFQKGADLRALGAQCASLEKEWGAQSPPHLFIWPHRRAVRRDSKIPRPCRTGTRSGFARIVIEKPIGYDLDSARALNCHPRRQFEESQIFPD